VGFIAIFLQNLCHAKDEMTCVIVRHAEKSTGIDPSLTDIGKRRAFELKELTVPLRVAAVYSTNAKRTTETAQPTANAIGKEVRVYSLNPSNPDPAWFAALRAEHSGQTVLIVGHSNTIGPLIRGLGVSGEFPIGEQEFDWLFIVTSGDGGSSVCRLRYGEGSLGGQRSLQSTAGSPDNKLKEFSSRLGHHRADPPPGVKFIPVRRVGNLLYLSGSLPFIGHEGIRKEHQGKVGGEKGMSVENAREAAPFATLNLLNDAQKHLGSLSRVVSVVEVFGMVNSGKKFTQQSQVIDGCSELLLDVFGEQVGSHTRYAFGVAELPLNSCVEIKIILQVADED
jgi:enamine deaminase RidA (YjgF/YER057c/UK114 family)/phosphohistidine phosphatase SixA